MTARAARSTTASEHVRAPGLHDHPICLPEPVDVLEHLVAQNSIALALLGKQTVALGADRLARGLHELLARASDLLASGGLEALALVLELAERGLDELLADPSGERDIARTVSSTQTVAKLAIGLDPRRVLCRPL